ncbi:hypothetical protein AVEN_274855-1 [Araneus ventricosus]|uniref:Uncharacterized protein n=1 Tax=Araneus ventricosus TaxID=182803 RepID=A0A4Y2IAG4_ARAVE|nr:hypothetical protein AVEN_274855-1 [Araneus ventricosus]
MPDTFRVNTSGLKEICREKISKRAVLSTAHRLFDTIGATCPVSLVPKLLLQNIWKMKITWEDEVYETARTEILNWLKNVAYIENIEFPKYFGAENVEHLSSHFFCDASKCD